MAMPGYNPNMSLLPNGGGTIQPMSGGGLPPNGFNPSNSLLPPAGGSISPFSGGFFNEPIHIIGGTKTGTSGTTTATGTGTGTDPIVDASKKPQVADYKPMKLTEQNIKPTSFQISWDKKVTDIIYTATATPKTPAVTPITKPINGALDATNPIFTFTDLTPDTEYTVIINAQKTGATTSLSSDTLTVKTSAKNATNNTDKNTLIPTKDITLFGEILTLNNPKLLKDENFTESQKTALQKFGLDGPGLTFTKKRAVVQALFDGQCNTDLPLIFKRNCDPIREIVQSLALNLLSKMKPTPNSNIDGLKPEEVPEVIYAHDKTTGDVTICLKFKPSSLSILSKFGLKPTIQNQNISKSVVLQKPNGLKQEEITPTSIQVSWENRIDGVTYSAMALRQGKRGIKGVIDKKVGNNMKTENKFTFNNLSPNFEYSIVITATQNKNFLNSDPILIKTQALPLDSIKPLNPISKDITETEFTITWDKKDLVTYTSEATDKDGKKIQGIITDNSAKFTGLTHNTKYTVIITASKDGKTEKSDDIEVSTKSVNAPVSIAPQGLSKTAETVDSFTVSWTNPIEGVVYTATAKGPSGVSDIGTISSDNTSVTFSSLSTKGEYDVTVESKKDGKSDSSSIKISFGTPEPTSKLEKPTGIKVNYRPPPQNALFITFNKSKDVDYNVTATLNGSDIKVQKKKIEAANSILVTTYTIDNPQAGKYIITVTATNDEETSVSDPFEYNYNPDAHPPPPPTMVGGDSTLITTLGIQNPNSWCYCISMMQFLYSLPSIRNAILAYKCDSFKLPTKEEIDAMPDREGKLLTDDDITNNICALKMVFESLNSSTTKFTDKDYKSKFTNQSIKDDQILPIRYLMKFYLTRRQPKQQVNSKGAQIKNRDGNPANFHKVDSNQQDADEFLKLMFEMFDKSSIKDITNEYKYYIQTQINCEEPTIKGKTRLDINNPELFINLNIQNLLNEKDISFKNKLNRIQKSKQISLQELINYFSKNQKMAETVQGCAGPIEYGIPTGKGPYTESSMIIPTANNKFLFILVQKPPTDPTQASRISNEYSTIIEPTITVNKSTYNLYSAVLYGGSGSTGHYTYHRFYYPPSESNKTLVNLPYISYNDSEATVNGGVHTLEQNSYLVIYQIVNKGDYGNLTEEPNSQCNNYVRPWLDNVKDKTKITPEEKQFIVRTIGIEEKYLNECIEYFRTKGEKIGFAEEEEEEEEEESSSNSNEEEEEESGSNSNEEEEEEEEEESGSNSNEENNPAPIKAATAKASREAANKAAANKAAANKAQRAKNTENMPSPSGLFGKNEEEQGDEAAAGNVAKVKLQANLQAKSKELNNHQRATARKRGWKGTNNNDSYKAYSEYGNKMSYTRANRELNKKKKEKLTDNIISIKKQLNSTTSGGKRKTFKKAALKRKHRTMKKQRK